MKYFIKRLLYFSLFFFGPLFILEEILTSELNRGIRYNFQADWHDLKNHNSEVLFVGNSRTWVHINPFEVEKQTGLSAEIIGHDAGDIQLLWLKFKQYAKNNCIPKYLFLQFDPFFVKTRIDIYGIENLRTCFYFRRGIEMEGLEYRDGFHFYYKYLPLSAMDLKGFIKFCLRREVPNEYSYLRNKGFKAQKLNWEGDWFVCPEETSVEDISCYVDSFYHYCNRNSIQLYSVFSPLSPAAYKRVSGLERMERHHNSLNKILSSNFIYLDYNSEILYNDSTLFYNHMHLNSKGVAVFMNQFLNDTTIYWLN